MNTVIDLLVFFYFLDFFCFDVILDIKVILCGLCVVKNVQEECYIVFKDFYFIKF